MSAAREPIPRILATRTLAENAFFEVRTDTIPDRYGDPYPYHTIDCRMDAVVVVPRCVDGRLLVERIYRHPVRRWVDEFPAGGIAPGEDPVAAAIRELAEETGHAGRDARLLSAFEVMPGLLRMRLHIVAIDACAPVTTPSLEAMELLTVRQLTPDEAWRCARAGAPSSFLLLGLWAAGIPEPPAR
jgi:ADP-ribose pyrophosphatase